MGGCGLRVGRGIALVSAAVALLSGCKIVTVAGGGSVVPSDGLLGTNARFGPVQSVERHPQGGVVFTTHTQVIRLLPDQRIDVLHESPAGFGGPAVTEDGTIYVPSGTRILRISPDGRTETYVDWTEAEAQPLNISADGSTLYVGFRWAGNLQILRMSGLQIDFPPGTQGLGTYDFAVAPGGTIYAVEVASHYVKRVTSDGVGTFYAGTGSFGFSGDGGPATDAELWDPRGVELTPDGGLLIADSSNARIRRVAPNGTISTVAGNGPSSGPSGDGGLATSAVLSNPLDIAAESYQEYWIAEGVGRVRYVGLTSKAPPIYKYVALGDSYSSGDGLGQYFEPAAQGCHRSKLAYPTLVRPPNFNEPVYKLKDDPTSDIDWGFQACSGATTFNVVDSGQQGRDPLPQLALDRSTDPNPNDLPVDADTDLVTISIGGNDVEWADVLRHCFFTPDCTTEPYLGRPLAEFLRIERDGVAPLLEEIYSRIRSQAPNAQVLVLGYPQVFPASEDEQKCPKLNVPGSEGFSTVEQNYLRQATSEMNQTIAARVEAAQDVAFVPVDTVFAGHEVCGNRGEWINGFSTGDGASFHPNAAGHRLGYAAAVNTFLRTGS